MSLLRPRLSSVPCTCRAFSTSSYAAAPFAYTSLPARSLLPLSGPDATKFLQGLLTNDVRRIGTAGSSGERGLYAALLKADGRMIQDVFVYPHTVGEVPGFLLESEASGTDTLRTYLKRHILRSKVKLGKTAEVETKVHVVWRTDEEASEEVVRAGEEWLEGLKAGRDSRTSRMGWRWAGPEVAPPSTLFEESTPSHHTLLRLSLAVPEGPTEWPTLPLEGSLDFMNGVDYRKGCYVGQELTARTHHRGVVRKRGVAFRLFREGEPVPTTLLPSSLSSLTPHESPIPLPSPLSSLTPLTSTSSRPRPSGKLGSSLHALSPSGPLTLAYGSVRLEHLEPDGIFVVKPPTIEGEPAVVEEGRWLAKAFVPEWVAEKLREEAELKAEQAAQQVD